MPFSFFCSKLRNEHLDQTYSFHFSIFQVSVFQVSIFEVSVFLVRVFQVPKFHLLPCRRRLYVQTFCLDHWVICKKASTLEPFFWELCYKREQNVWFHEKIRNLNIVWKSGQTHDHCRKNHIFSVKSTFSSKKRTYTLKSWFHRQIWAWSRFKTLYKGSVKVLKLAI